MLENKKAKTAYDAFDNNLKEEIRKRVEQLDKLKMNMLRCEYELYTLYSELEEVKSKPPHPSILRKTPVTA